MNIARKISSVVFLFGLCIGAYGSTAQADSIFGPLPESTVTPAPTSTAFCSPEVGGEIDAAIALQIEGAESDLRYYNQEINAAQSAGQTTQTLETQKQANLDQYIAVERVLHDQYDSVVSTPLAAPSPYPTTYSTAYPSVSPSPASSVTPGTPVPSPTPTPKWDPNTCGQMTRCNTLTVQCTLPDGPALGQCDIRNNKCILRLTPRMCGIMHLKTGQTIPVDQINNPFQDPSTADQIWGLCDMQHEASHAKDDTLNSCPSCNSEQNAYGKEISCYNKYYAKFCGNPKVAPGSVAVCAWMQQAIAEKQKNKSFTACLCSQRIPGTGQQYKAGTCAKCQTQTGVSNDVVKLYCTGNEKRPS